LSKRGKYTVTTRRIIATSKLFSNGRLYMPKEVRRILNVDDGDTVVWIIDYVKDEVIVSNSEIV